MPYSTPALFIQQFGSIRAAELFDNNDQDLTADCFSATIAGTDTTSFEAIDVVAATDALVSLHYQLTASYNTINSYLMGRYDLPLSFDIITSSPLERLANDITRYLAATTADLMSDTIEMRYNDAIKWLKDVASGKAMLSPVVDTTKGRQTAITKSKGGNKIDLGGYG